MERFESDMFVVVVFHLALLRVPKARTYSNHKTDIDCELRNSVKLVITPPSENDNAFTSPHVEHNLLK